MYRSGCEATEFIVYVCEAKLLKFLNGSNWQDEERTWTTVEQVYETRWDCLPEPG